MWKKKEKQGNGCRVTVMSLSSYYKTVWLAKLQTTTLINWTLGDPVVILI